MPSELISVGDAAEMLGLKNRAVLFALGRGEFPNARKLNPDKETSSWLIPVADVKAAMKKRAAAVRATQEKKQRAQVDVTQAR